MLCIILSMWLLNLLGCGYVSLNVQYCYSYMHVLCLYICVCVLEKLQCFTHILQRDKKIKRVRNVIKTNNRKARQAGECSLPTKSQRKQETDLTWQYPVVSTNMDIEDPSTDIKVLVVRSWPQDTVLLPLLKKKNKLTAKEGCLLLIELLASEMLRPGTPALSRPAVVRLSCSSHVHNYVIAILWQCLQSSR